MVVSIPSRGRRKPAAVTIILETDEGDKLTVTALVRHVIPGRRSGHPDTWTPDEGGEVEDIEIFDFAGLAVPYEALTERQRRELPELLREAAEEGAEDERAARAEYRLDCAQDELL